MSSLIFFDGAAAEVGFVDVGTASNGTPVTPIPTLADPIGTRRGAANLSISGARLEILGTLFDINNCTIRIKVRPGSRFFQDATQVVLQIGDSTNFSTDSFEIDIVDLGGANFQIGFANNNGGASRYVQADNTTPTSCPLGVWTDFYLVKNGTSGTFYYAPADGVTPLIVGATLTLGSPTNNAMRIGDSSFGPQYRGRQSTQDLVIWEDQLTYDEMMRDRLNPKPRRRDKVWAHYPLREVSNLTADFSGNGHTLTQTGTIYIEEACSLRVPNETAQIFVVSDGIYGTLTSGLAPFAGTSAGQLIFQGTAAGAAAPFGGSSSGSVLVDVTGSASGAAAPFAATATAEEKYLGAVSAAFAPFSLTALAREIFLGAAAGAVAPFAASATGLEVFLGSVSAALAPFAASALGEEEVSGSGSATQRFELTASGQERFQGSASAAAAPFAASGTALEIFAGSVSGALASFAATGSAQESFQGSGTGAAAAFAASAIGVSGDVIAGSAMAALAPFAATGTAREVFVGAVTASLAASAASGAGLEKFEGALAAALAPFAASGIGTGENVEDVTGSGGAALASFGANAVAFEVFRGTGSAGLAPFAATGLGRETIQGAATAALAKFGLTPFTGSAILDVTGSGTAALAAFFVGIQAAFDSYWFYYDPRDPGYVILKKTHRPLFRWRRLPKRFRIQFK